MTVAIPVPADATLDTMLRQSMNMAVPWFLMASYLYYCRDFSLLTDERYDGLCKELAAAFDDLVHMHKYLIDPQALNAGTAFHIKSSDYPLRIKHAACHLVGLAPERVIVSGPQKKPKTKKRAIMTFPSRRG